jgi:hypothetical protein
MLKLLVIISEGYIESNAHRQTLRRLTFDSEIEGHGFELY